MRQPSKDRIESHRTTSTDEGRAPTRGDAPTDRPDGATTDLRARAGAAAAQITVCKTAIETPRRNDFSEARA